MKLSRLYFLSILAAVVLGSVIAESAFALRAPTRVTGSDIPYYYVSDSIGENGKFPQTWVGFYWDSNSGTKTITYNPRMCNDGGYDDSKDGDPRVTIYRIKADGTPDQTAAGTIVGATGIDDCHNNDKSTPFTFDLDGVALDSKINMYGVAVRVDSKGTGSSRAWFSLESTDVGVEYGALGDKPIGYSRDITGGAGGYYNLQTGFGSCDAARQWGTVAFFDTDKSKYQDTKWDDNALRIQFQDRRTGDTIKNDAAGMFGSSPGIGRRPGTATWFNITAGSAENASIEFYMQANTGYRLNINSLREGNDITVQVPTNEIYGKAICGDEVEPVTYELTPHVDTATDFVRPGGDIVFQPNVTSNKSISSNDTSWSVRRIVIPPAGSEPYTGMRTSGNFDCAYYTSKGMGCTDIESGNRMFSTTSPTYVATVSGYSYSVANNVPFGTRICYALAIDSRNETPSKPAETLKCVMVAKTPRLQVWGNDVRVGSNFLGIGLNNASSMDVNSGSWGEYGVLASGSINSLGSGGLSLGVGLTFANTSLPGGSFTTIARLAELGAIPDVKTYLLKAGSAEYSAETKVTINDRGNAPIMINGAAAYKANTVDITTGTVTIRDDIVNNSTGADLSQMVIIADNIVIDPRVKQIDAWLIATNTVNTCAVPGDPTIANCGTEQLTINGPIMAKQLLLYRAGGVDTDQNSAAEVVNLRGDAYIWLRRLSGLTGTVRTVYTRELAPRY